MNIKKFLVASVLLLSLLFSSVTFADSGVYAGGPLYYSRDVSINELKTSGFTNVVVWTIHIEQDGSLGFNGEFPLVRDGIYIGDNSYPEFRNDIASLKTGNTSITRVEFGLSAAGSGTYQAVRDLLSCSQSHCGTGTNSILYRNFQALRDAFPTVDALNNDDESEYHADSAVPFHIMLADIGFKTAIVPYTRSSFWNDFVTRVNQARPGTVDLLYLQNYAGGAYNNPCNWDLGIPVYPGLWSRDDTPTQVESQMRIWRNNCPSVVKGGFMWIYDDFDNSPQVEQYAAAINNVFDSTTPPTSAVSLYQHCPLGAGYEVPLDEGTYTLSQLQSMGMTNNDISSIHVADGYQVTIYQNDGFSGFEFTLSESDDCLNNNTEGRTDGTDWNDALSSVVVAQVSGDANIALNQPVQVSSTLNSRYPGSNVVDGDNSSTTSRWVSSRSGFPHWIEIDLQQQRTISSVALYSGYNGYNRPIQDFQIQRWNGSAWVDILTVADNSDPARTFVFQSTTTDRVRLYMTRGTDPYARVYEVEVIGH